MNLRGLIVPLPEEGLDDADFAMDDEEIEDDGLDGDAIIFGGAVFRFGRARDQTRLEPPGRG